MESYLPISFLNDFIFCPRSIYFHQLYGSVNRSFYQSKVQVEGEKAHKPIDDQHYATAKSVLQAIEVYSTQYKICGKIDLYDAKKQQLVERKKRIKVIYDGYIFQVYAQYHCLTEMGYPISSIKLHSLDDNKRYTIPLPEENKPMQAQFEQLIYDVHTFDLAAPFVANANKCNGCIYHTLCDYSLADETNSDNHTPC